MKNNHNLLMKMKNLEKFSGAIKRCVAIAMASMLFATTGFSLDTHPVKAQEVSSSADKIEIPEISKDAFKKYKKISGIGANTILGADFTYYQQCLEWGKSYKNYMSQSVDNIFDYVKSQGINTISLKVAVNPTGENAYLSLENAIKTLKAVKASNTNLKTNTRCYRSRHYNKNLRHNIKRNIIFFFSKEILADFIDCRPQFAGTPAFDAEKNSGFGVNLKNAAQIGIKTTDKFVIFGFQRPTFPFGNIFALINNQPIVQKVTTREIFNYFMNPFLRKAAILQKFIVGKSVAEPAENYSDFGNNHKRTAPLVIIDYRFVHIFLSKIFVYYKK